MRCDYFVIERAGPNTYPLLGWDQSASAFRKGRAVAITEPVKLRLAEPVPPRPIMVDHHSLPQPVLSTRLKDVLAPLQLSRVQLIPADVKVKDDVLRYWLLHIFNEIHCLDRTRSVCSFYPDGAVLGIEFLALDEEALGRISLEERLVFVLAESTSVYLFHRSVVDRVMALTPPPDGLRFIPVADWNDSAGFR
jgi:hypothetical protein